MGAVTRELSFGLSSPQAGVKKENGAPQAGVKQENGAAVQHVESLGAWAQNEAHRKPSIKLEGQSTMPSTDSRLLSVCSLMFCIVCHLWVLEKTGSSCLLLQTVRAWREVFCHQTLTQFCLRTLLPNL